MMKNMSKHEELLKKWPETQGGWIKSPANPVLGGQLGTCFDISVLKEADKFRMWISWRPKESVALVESVDGVHWNSPQICLGPNPSNQWEKRINRPTVMFHDQKYHMWYTGQSEERSWIGYATSNDGISWKRMSTTPVLSADMRWEKKSVMCPHVLWDDDLQIYRMWYSAGGQYEPKVIGYATSRQGISWLKNPKPILEPNKKVLWEKDRVAAVQVIPHNNWFLMFYVGFADINHARIGLVRSRDGITNWERHRANPLISPGQDKWDHDACYKPYTIFDGTNWLLWYNGRHGSPEQIGLAIHKGEDLGFE
jgi:beta-1,2-mannobiose phosphorylase / 1,2-beta-oligomannan phosphorylase